MKARLQILGSALVFSFAVSSGAFGQLISIRTAPVTVSEQFYTFPSRLLGMGGGLALQDIEADPFNNPAAGARVNGTLITATPTLYNLPQYNGFGRMLPMAILSHSGNAFGAFSFTPQQLESAHQQTFTPVPFAAGTTSALSHSGRFTTNKYTFGMIGHTFAKGSALALSGSYASLQSLHMVDLLYPQAQSITQGGHLSDVRLGYMKEFEPNRTLEAVIVRNNVEMHHEVTYVDWRWDPVQRNWAPPTSRVESNSDQTTTWGAHLAYTRPMPNTKWRMAGAMTANTKTHPHIPNYDFMRIPRDPGNSWAFSLAIGTAYVDSTSTWAFDVSYEPTWTNTWATAATQTKTNSGSVIPVGGLTVENQFVFSNTNFHVGYMHNWNPLALQLGMSVRRVNYWLDQYNHITQLDRAQDEGWTEVTPSWGLTFDFAEFNLRYFGHQRGGGFSFGSRAWAVDESMSVPSAGGDGVDVVAAPSGPLNMNVAKVIVHQIGVSIPVGHKH